MTFSPKLNILAGLNGAGKSNILEAAAILASGESHRDAEGRHLLQWEKDEMALRGIFEGEDDVAVEIRQKRGRPRQVTVNNASQKRLRDWIGRVPVVMFSPEDLDLVKGEPSLRRRMLNDVLSQVDADYAESFQRYAKIIEERNAALRRVQEGEKDRSVLEPWDFSLLKEGAFLTRARREFLETFSDETARRHGDLSSGKETARLAYKPSLLAAGGSLDDMVAANRRRLLDLREGEIALGSSLIGPHRDDVEIFIDGNTAKAFASQGQQRTLSLAVKWAEGHVLKQRRGRDPLFLLDDMFSELDPSRRENLTEALVNGFQCLITLTALSDWPESSRFLSGNGGQVLEVSGGRALPAETPHAV